MGTKNAGPIKRLPSLADLAQGFIESFKNTGNDWFERDGDPNLRPDAHEFKYLSYSQKIYWHIQNVIKQNKIMAAIRNGLRK